MTTHAGSDLATAPRSLVWTADWLFSPSRDAVFLTGSASVPLALFWAWSVGSLTTVDITLLWLFAFHGPHLWATWSRTVVDRSWWRSQRRRRHAQKAARWFLLGPILVAANTGIQAMTGRPDLVVAFLLFALGWGYHHVVQQHCGLLSFYRAKAGEFGRREQLLHKHWLTASLWLPVLVALSAHISDPAEPGAISGLGIAASILFVGLQLAGLASLGWRAMVGRPINLGEVVVAATAVTLHWVVITGALPRGLAAMDSDPHAAWLFVPLVTIYHDIQYHALVWHYNQSRLRDRRPQQPGAWARRLNRNIGVYLSCAVIYTALTFGIAATPLRTGLENPTDLASWPTQLAIAFAVSLSLVHYDLDRRIWRISRDPSLQQMLGLR